MTLRSLLYDQKQTKCNLRNELSYGLTEFKVIYTAYYQSSLCQATVIQYSNPFYHANKLFSERHNMHKPTTENFLEYSMILVKDFF